MKIAKRLIALVLTAIIVAGTFAPMGTKAAVIRGGLHFDCWISPSRAQFTIKDQGATKYQYKIYYNSGKYKSTSRVYVEGQYLYTYDNEQAFEVLGLPKYACSYVSVRIYKNDRWTSWSSKYLLIPTYETCCLPVKKTVNTTKKTCTISWKKTTGMTNYDLYFKEENGKWKKVKSYTNKSVCKYTFKNINGKKFKNQTYYYYRVVARRKVKGKWKKSLSYSNASVSGSFGFNLKRGEE